MSAFELGAFSTEVKPDVSGTCAPALPGNPTNPADLEPQFKCGEEAQAEEFTQNSSAANVTWTPERVRELIRLVNLDPPLSSKEIARRLSVNKNQVMGRCFREGITLPLATKPFVPYTPTPDVFNGGGCLFSYGDPGAPGFHFCGALSTMEPIGSAWCSIHSAIVYRKSEGDVE